MTRSTIYTKTDKGERLTASASRELANDLRKVLNVIDGTSSVDQLQHKAKFRSVEWLDRALAALVADGLIIEADESAGLLDFTNLPASAPTEDQQGKAAREAAERTRQDAEQQARKQAEEQARKQVEEQARLKAVERARREAEEQARKQLEEQTRRAAEERARQQAEQQTRKQIEEQARRTAEERERQEAEQQARKQLEEQARRATEDRARQEAEQQACKQVEEQTRRAAEERAQRDAELQARKQADDQELKLAAERVRRRAAERVGPEAEEQARKKAEEELKLAAERVHQRAAEHARREAEEQARKQAEEQQRKQAEEETRKQAEEQERLQAVERARQEAAEQARKLAEEQERRLAAERAREEAEHQARILAEDLARRLAEDKIRRDAEAKAKREAKERAGQEAEEKVRRDAEERARRDAEEKARWEAEEKIRREAVETARREAEEAVRREAAEHARLEAEEDARREAERARQDVEAQTRMAAEEKVWREAEEKFRRDEEKAKAKRLKKEGAKEVVATSPRLPKWSRPAALAAAILLALAPVILHLISFDGQIPHFEKLLSGQFQQPVKIQALYLMLVPEPGLRLEGVSIGGEGQIKIGQIKALGGFDNLSSDKKAFKSIELDSPVLTEEGLGWILFGKSSAGSIAFGPVSVLNGNLQSKNFSIPAFEAKLQPDGKGTWKTIAVEAMDKNLSLELTPQDASVQIDFKARSYRIPFGSSLTLEELAASATVDPAGLTVAEFKAFAYGGILSGSGRLTWGEQWRLSGKLNARQVDASRLFPGVVDDGRLVGDATYAMQSPDAATLFATSRLEGSFAVARGNLLGVDLERMLQGAGMKGNTKFTELAGVLVHDRGATQLRQVRLVEGAISANGAVDVDANTDVRGRFALELRTPMDQRRANLALSGTLKQIEWGRP